MNRTLRNLRCMGALLLLVLLIAQAAVGAGKAIPPERAHPRLAPSLQLLAETAAADPAALGPLAAGSGIPLDGDRIHVIIEPTSGRVTHIDESAIRALGGRIEARSESLIRASVSVDRLVQIADQVSGIAYIREPYKPRALAVTSQGVALTGATDFHTAGYTGTGVKVAIIDLGFDGLADAQAAGELAHVVYTWNYITGTSNVETTGEVHGTAVAEIVADMAPGASLYLLLISDEVDLDNAAQYCIDHGIRVINHSVGWYNTGYYDGTGYVAGVANDARDQDILWVNAAGNEAGDGHWQGSFTDTDSDGFLDFGTGSDYVDEDVRDEGARIFVDPEDVVRIYMTWDDWTQSDQDYDLYLYDSDGTIVASSTGGQNGYQQPTESIYYSVPASGPGWWETYDNVSDPGYYEIVIDAYDAPEKPAIEFFVYLESGADPDMQHHVVSSSIIEPANSAKVVAVGAIARYNWATGPIESFSSRGPSNASKYAASRVKPDLCGVDGVSSYTYGSFYGTSAATPHVAGAAALLLSEDPTRTANELQTLLEGTAIDMGTAGKDNTYGSGRLNLEPALTEPLRGYWRLNEGAGPVAGDASTYGNDGTISGASWTTSTDGSGALSFDGVNDLVTISADSSLVFSTAITVEAWIRPDVLGGVRRVLSKDASVTADNHFMLVLSDNLLRFYVYTTAWKAVTGTTALTPGVWHHIAGVYTGAQLRVYVDGVLDGSLSVTGAIAQGQVDQETTIGGKSGASQLFAGRIDEVKLTGVALDPADFNLLPAGPTPPARVADFAASDGDDGQSVLSWTNPADADLAQVVVQRKTGSYPTSHTDGTNVYDNASPTPGAAVNYTNTGLTNGTTYYYAVFGRDSDSTWNDTVTAGQNADTGTPSEPVAPGSADGYWQFNEGSGSTAADSSGNENDGTISGASWTTSTDGSGALSFDGVNDLVTVPASASLVFSNAITVEAWIRPDVLGEARRVVSKDGSVPGDNHFMLILSDNVVRFYVYTTAWRAVTGTTALTPGVWHHIAGVYTGAQLRVYVDGVLDGSLSVTGAIAQGQVDQETTIGGKSGASQLFAGRIDEVRITGEALDPADFNLIPPTGAASLAGGRAAGAGPSIHPSPVRRGETLAVQWDDEAVTFLRFEVYDLAGHRIFASSWEETTETSWDLRTDSGEHPAAGFYIIAIYGRSTGGELLQPRILKVAVLN